MAELPNMSQLIAMAVQLPLSVRVALVNAMRNRRQPAIGSDATQSEFDAAWLSEIARRVDDIKHGVPMC